MARPPRYRVATEPPPIPSSTSVSAASAETKKTARIVSKKTRVYTPTTAFWGAFYEYKWRICVLRHAGRPSPRLRDYPCQKKSKKKKKKETHEGLKCIRRKIPAKKSTFSSTLDRKSIHITTVMSDEDAAYLTVSVLKKKKGVEKKKSSTVTFDARSRDCALFRRWAELWCPREGKRFVPNPAETDGDSFTGMDQSVDGAPHQPPPHVCLSENL